MRRTKTESFRSPNSTSMLWIRSSATGSALVAEGWTCSRSDGDGCAGVRDLGYLSARKLGGDDDVVRLPGGRDVAPRRTKPRAVHDQSRPCDSRLGLAKRGPRKYGEQGEPVQANQVRDVTTVTRTTQDKPDRPGRGTKAAGPDLARLRSTLPRVRPGS